jgi:hypothetical protein
MSPTILFGNHIQEELAKFDERIKEEVENFKIPHII